jgi:aspartate kinase
LTFPSNKNIFNAQIKLTTFQGKNMSKMLVQKYGGTSVGSIERIKAVAKRAIKTKQELDGLVIVVSAMGDTTDDLIKLQKQITDKPNPREYDALISTGENISAALLAMCINAMGYNAISLTGSQAGIYTESTYSRAKILKVDTKRILQEIAKGQIVIVTGFQGINDFDDVTTIGRGGSDTSAVVLAAALKINECEIYTDVDGVYTTDPRKIKSARKISQISYDEMLELASLGAKVLHPRSVEIAKEQNIIIHVRSSFSENLGTIVKEENRMELTKPVTGVTVNEEEAIVSILGLPDKPGIAGLVFEHLANANLNVDMIIQSAHEGNKNKITYTVNEDSLSLAKEISEKAAKELGAQGIESDTNIAKISIVGVGMISKPGIAARMFNALGKNGINIKLISTSEIKISCVINLKDADKALEILHKEFELDKITE